MAQFFEHIGLRNMDNVFEGKSAVIENLLYTGAYILAGAPKIGKSFLVAQIAHHVSTGQELWGYKVHQGTVLYLALEDDESRLQRRMFRMFGVEGTSSLHFATNAKMIGSGLNEQMEKFIREHSDTKLIIVDTLQKVREVVNDSYSYSSDYEVIGKLNHHIGVHPRRNPGAVRAVVRHQADEGSRNAPLSLEVRHHLRGKGMGGNNDVRLFLRQKRKQAHAHRPVKPGYERVQRRVRVRRAVEPAENAGHLRRHEMVAVAARLVKDGVDLLERVGDHHLVALCVFKNIRLQRAGRCFIRD